MPELIERLLTDLKRGLADLYRSRLRHVYLFGSYARRQARPDSDVDVLIVLDSVDSYGAEILRTEILIGDVSLEYGVSVSRVFVSERDWAVGNSPFLRNVRSEAIAA